MTATHRRTLRASLLSLALGVAVAGCSSDEGTGPGGVNSAVVGTWNATTFVAGGTDFVAQGMALSFTFNADGTYSFSILNDQGGLCDPGMVNCSDSGNFTASGTQITLDPGTVDVATLNYTIVGNTMTVNATIEGTAIAATFDKL